MDKKSIIGLVLMFLVLLGYSFWQSKKTEKQRAEMAERHAKEMTEAAEEEMARYPVDSLQAIEKNKAAAQSSTGDNGNNVWDAANPFVLATQGEEKHYTIENELCTIAFNNKGGRISGIELKDYLTCKKADTNLSRQLVLFNEKKSEFYLQFFAQNRCISTDVCYFECIMPEKTRVEGEDSTVVRMRLYPNTVEDGNVSFDKTRYIEWVYTVYGNQYMLGIDLNFVNTQDLIPTNTNFIDLVWKARLERFEKSLKMESMNTAVYYKPVADKVRYLKETRDDRKDLTTPTRWISFKQQFFNVCLVADKEFAGAEIRNYTRKEVATAGEPDYLKDLEATIGIPYNGGADQNLHMRLYAGPNKYRTLRGYHLDLERVIPLGWSFFLMHWINRFAVIPVFDWLEKSGLGYGIIILILTILLKIVIFPFTYKSYKGSAKMRVVQPQVAEINAKYPKPEQNMEKQKATMALYKKAGISPMSGCLPMLFQFPILVAMFRFFPASIELRQQPFLWADDLSSYDSVWNFGFNIPMYGDHMSLFALMMAVTNLLYTMMTMRQQPSNNAMPGMKFMMYAMPVILLGAFNSYSSGLNYYYIISTLITFLQMYAIRKFLNDEKVLAQIEENKKKPVKKSKFQARLEAMMKQQEEIARQQQRRK